MISNNDQLLHKKSKFHTHNIQFGCEREVVRNRRVDRVTCCYFFLDSGSKSSHHNNNHNNTDFALVVVFN
jgi:hypothetical protein